MITSRSAAFVAAALFVWSASADGQVGPTGVIEGRVMGEGSSTGIPGALVLLQRAGAEKAAKTTVSDDRGRFSFVSVEAGTYTLGVQALGYAAEPSREIEFDGGALRIDLIVLPAPLEAGGIEVVVTRSPGSGEDSQLISGVGKDGDAEGALPDLDIELRNVSEEVVGRTISDHTGHFIFAVGKPGLYRLRVSRMGYDSASTAEVALAPGQDVYVELMARPTPVGLGEIRISARRTLSLLEASGFYRRRQLGRGEFFDPAEVASRPAVQPTQLLRRLPDITVVGKKIWFRGTIGPGGLPCHPSIILDGMELREIHIDEIIPKSSIQAVEVYKHLGEVPQQWRGLQTCGVIAIWTKP